MADARADNLVSPLPGAEENPVKALLDDFENAPTDRREETYQRLVGAVWRNGTATELGLRAVPGLVDRLNRVPDHLKGHLAILLGLLAEVEYPVAGVLNAAVRRGLNGYLALWRAAPSGDGLSLALQYLVAHFPTDRERIMAVANEVGLDVPDRSRLDRALTRFDPDDPNPDIGRVFPYPRSWDMDDAERAFDQAWVRSLGSAQVTEQWHKDTHTVLGFTGAKAYWAVRHGRPTPFSADSLAPRYPAPLDADVHIFRRHADAFRCPRCAGAMTFAATAASCRQCSRQYPISRGMLDLTATGDDVESNGEDFLMRLSTISTMGHFVEAFARPNFKRLCGFSWDGPVTPAFEEEYIIEHVRPVDGPVLDVAAGPGGWTLALAKAVGHDRVIALDLMPVMLAALRERLPEVPAVVASARTLPFGDATLGAAMCWNGPHAFFEDTGPAIAEIGRCLRPGGTFTTYTFRTSDDPVYRYFVGSHHFPNHAHGLQLFDIDEFKGWLDRAGMTVREESGIGLAVFLTAVKTR